MNSPSNSSHVTFCRRLGITNPHAIAHATMVLANAQARDHKEDLPYSASEISEAANRAFNPRYTARLRRKRKRAVLEGHSGPHAIFTLTT